MYTVYKMLRDENRITVHILNDRYEVLPCEAEVIERNCFYPEAKVIRDQELAHL